jgi:hypothetical protein
MTEIEEDYRWKYSSFDFYKEPEDKDKWLKCPECGLTPRIWVFDNGRFAHCVCGDRYNKKHQVKARPVMYYLKKTGGFKGYDSDELRKKWNRYIKDFNKQLLISLKERK